jgi:hypothetical protein
MVKFWENSPMGRNLHFTPRERNLRGAKPPGAKGPGAKPPGANSPNVPKISSKSSIGSKVIQQSHGHGRTDRRTDRRHPPRNFFCINFLPFHSLRSLTLFALFAHGMIIKS